MSKKTKTKSEQAFNQNSTSTPTVAPWLSQGYEDYAGQIGNYATMDPSKMVAGASDLQNQAFSNASGLGGWQDYLAQAGDATKGVLDSGPVSIINMDREEYSNP